MRAVFAEIRGGLGSGIGRSFSEMRDVFFLAVPFRLVDLALVVDLAETRRVLDVFAEVAFLAASFFFASELALRLTRRWTFVIASIKSSFLMECQPGTP